MKRLVAVLVFMGLNSVCLGACPEQIKTFYTDYLNNVLQDDSKNAALCKTYLTDELIEKVDRLKNATGADPIIRAQDTNKDAVETLSVKSLADDWYLVQYFWKKGDSDTVIEIPLKAQMIDGVCKITSITPIWNGAQYGDELISCNDKATNKIDQTSELTFLKSFYDAYTAAYCQMPKDLNAKLSALRSHHLSKIAMGQFKEAELENLQDGLAGYDKLIDNFDFDCLWRKRVQYNHLNGNDYQIAYQVGNKVYKIVVAIKREDNNYLIDSISI